LTAICRTKYRNESYTNLLLGSKYLTNIIDL